MKGGSGFAEGTFRDRGDGSQLGVEPVGMYKKTGGAEGSGDSMVGGNIFTDIYHGFEDLGEDIGKGVEYLNPFGSGRPDHTEKKAKLLGRMLGKMMKHAHDMKLDGKGMSGGSWWSALKDGISDVVDFIPDLIVHGLGRKAGRPKKMKGGAEVERKVGGAILGNPDPYPVKGDSARIAGRGRPKKMCCACGNKKCKGCEMSGGAKAMVGVRQNDLLAMPNPVMANGVPPVAQLRGAYGGAKPSVKEKVMKAVEKKLGGKNLSGMTDKRAEMDGGMNLKGMTDRRAEMEEPKMGSGDGRKARAEIVKKVMKEKGMKMIEASKYVKEHNLYKK
jgi:hypothetical protein